MGNEPFTFSSNVVQVYQPKYRKKKTCKICHKTMGSNVKEEDSHRVCRERVEEKQRVRQKRRRRKRFD